MGERRQIRIALGGDAMLGRGVAAQLATTGPDGLVSGEVRDYLSGADLAVLNLECCISERGRPWEGAGKRFHFRAPPAAAAALAGLGVSCVTLANNHALDFGYAALSDTCERLAQAGIAAAGAGADVTQARAPALVEAGGLRVVERRDVRPSHPKAADVRDMLHAARAREITSLWRLAVKTGSEGKAAQA